MKKRQAKKFFKKFINEIASTLEDNKGVIISRDYKGEKNIHGFEVGWIVRVVGDSKWGKKYLECEVGNYGQTVPKKCILLKGDKL